MVWICRARESVMRSSAQAESRPVACMVERTRRLKVLRWMAKILAAPATSNSKAMATGGRYWAAPFF